MKTYLKLALLAITLSIATNASAQKKEDHKKESIEVSIKKLEDKRKTQKLSKHEKEKLKYLKSKQKVESKRKKRRARQTEFNKGH